MKKIFISLFLPVYIFAMEDEKPKNVARFLVAIDSAKKVTNAKPETAQTYCNNWFPGQKARSSRFLNIISNPLQANQANQDELPNYLPSNMLHELATETPPMIVSIKGKRVALIPCQSVDPNSKADTRLLEVLFAKLAPKTVFKTRKKKRDCHKSWLKEALYKQNGIKKITQSLDLLDL